MPRIDCSIIVTNYNKKPEWLMECMDSIKHQTFGFREVILVDDCSDDPRAHALATSIILPRNVGVAKARDIGVRMSRGELLLFVDADDKLAPDFLQQSVKSIANADIVYPSMVMFTDYTSTLHESPPVLKAKHLMDKKCAIPVTCMMKRDVYEILGGFKEMPIFEDWDFWIRASVAGFRFKKANTLLMYRQVEDSRVHKPLGFKTGVYRQIVAAYEVKEGKICLKE